ncbi:MAG: hypothetical protein JNL98_23790 [Bryobacterales bacterium]|nr:hypothetical protein [Bryobacterales bacterium]
MFLVVLGLVGTLSYVTGRSITAAQMRNADETHSTPPIIVDPRKSGGQPTPIEVRAASAMPTGAPVTPQQVVPIPPARVVTPPTKEEPRKEDSGRTVTASMSSGVLSPVRQVPTAPPVAPAAKPEPVKLAVAVAPVVKATPPPVPKSELKSAETRLSVNPAQQPAASVPGGAVDGPEEPGSGETFWQVGVVDIRQAASFTQKVAGLGLPVRLAAGQSSDGRRVLVGPLQSQTEVESARKTLVAAGYQHFLRRF